MYSKMMKTVMTWPKIFMQAIVETIKSFLIGDGGMTWS